jgi:Tfp pilus assembly major pilin PilA
MRKQQGMTFIGLVLTVAAVVFLAVIGIKLTPAYLEYMSVKKVIANIASQPNFKEMTSKDIFLTFQKNSDIDNVTSINAGDLVISQGANGTVIEVEYQVVVPLVGNVSALLDFYASNDE